MATERVRPTFRSLSREECEAVLGRNQVGRIAYLNDGQPDVEPIHYVLVPGWIVGRTSPGAKLDALVGSFYHVARVAFEVDEVDGPFRWRSVVVRGSFHLIDPAGAPWEREQWTAGVEALRRIVPETFRDGDPVPTRTAVFGITLQEVTGRSATEGAAS